MILSDLHFTRFPVMFWRVLFVVVEYIIIIPSCTKFLEYDGNKSKHSYINKLAALKQDFE